MTKKDAIALIRAMRETEGKSAVTIERLSSGTVTFGVKVAARSIRQARVKAIEEFEALEAKFKDGKG